MLRTDKNSLERFVQKNIHFFQKNFKNIPTAGIMTISKTILMTNPTLTPSAFLICSSFLNKKIWYAQN